jgi:hypothetical protein
MLRKDLPSLIKRLKAGLVILDPWYKIAAASGADENSNDGQSRVLSEIESIVNEANAALVIGHHFAKGNASGKNAIDRAAGAGAMARWGDVIASLRLSRCRCGGINPCGRSTPVSIVPSSSRWADGRRSMTSTIFWESSGHR